MGGQVPYSVQRSELMCDVITPRPLHLISHSLSLRLSQFFLQTEKDIGASNFCGNLLHSLFEVG